MNTNHCVVVCKNIQLGGNMKQNIKTNISFINFNENRFNDYFCKCVL